MARRIKNFEEEDAFTGWRHFLYWRPGQRKAVKRRASRRERREGKKEARQGDQPR